MFMAWNWNSSSFSHRLGHVLHEDCSWCVDTKKVWNCWYDVGVKGQCLLYFKNSMIRINHNHKSQTNPMHREEEPHNHHKTPGRQTRQSNQLSLPHHDDCKTSPSRNGNLLFQIKNHPVYHNLEKTMPFAIDKLKSKTELQYQKNSPDLTEVQ